MSGKKIYFERSEGGHDIVLEIPDEFDMVNIGSITGGCARVLSDGVIRVGGTIEHDAYSEVSIKWRFGKEQLVLEIQAGPNCERVPLVQISKALSRQTVEEREL